MRYIYVSRKGGKPLNIGVNAAKRRAHRLDTQDRAKIVKLLGAGLPTPLLSRAARRVRAFTGQRRN